MRQAEHSQCDEQAYERSFQTSQNHAEVTVVRCELPMSQCRPHEPSGKKDAAGNSRIAGQQSECSDDAQPLVESGVGGLGLIGRYPALA
jgi:hypothetical protein